MSFTLCVCLRMCIMYVIYAQRSIQDSDLFFLFSYINPGLKVRPSMRVRNLTCRPLHLLLPLPQFIGRVKCHINPVVFQIRHFLVVYKQHRGFAERVELSSCYIHNVILHHHKDVGSPAVVRNTDLMLDVFPVQLTRQLSRSNCTPTIQIICGGISAIVFALNPMPNFRCNRLDICHERIHFNFSNTWVCCS